jgi:hypothetical protein
MTFQIVLGSEQALAAGLTLAARDGAQGVEAARDRREKALLRYSAAVERATAPRQTSIL